MEVINLLKRGRGCTEHPIVRLANKLASVKGEVKILYSEEDIPPQVMNKLLSKNGFRVVEDRVSGNHREVVAVRE